MNCKVDRNQSEAKGVQSPEFCGELEKINSSFYLQSDS